MSVSITMLDRIDPQETMELLQDKFPGGQYHRQDLIGTKTVSVSVWQFNLVIAIQGENQAQCQLVQRPSKNVRRRVVVKQIEAVNAQEIYDFVSFVVLKLAGIASAILAGISGVSKTPGSAFQGADDLLLDAIEGDEDGFGGD